VPMDRTGRCRMKLAQLHPRSKQSLRGRYASNRAEDSRCASDAAETEIELEHEEILR
jgi:hypothetical protein